MSSNAPDSGKSERQDGSIFHRADYWTNRGSLFQEHKTVELTNLIELKSNYGLSTGIRDITVESSGGTVTHTGPEYRLSVTDSTGDEAILESAELGRYVPGYTAEAGIGIRAGSSMSTNQTARFGYFDDNNGFYIGQDGEGWFVGRRSGSTDTVIRSSAWNGDPLDGSGPSGLEHSITDGAIFQIDYTWYGYGTIEFKVFVPDEDNRQQGINLHQLDVSGSVSVDNPNLPIRAELVQDSSAPARDLFVGGRKYAIEGDYDPNRRRSGHEVTNVALSTDYTPVMSFRRKENITDGPFFEAVSVKLSEVSFINESTAPSAFKWVSGGTPSSTNWKSLNGVTTGETALEVVDDSTSLDGTNQFLDRSLVQAGGKKTGALTAGNVFDFDFIRRRPVTLMARGIGSASTAHVTADMREEW